MSPIDALPDLPWSKQARVEIVSTGAELVRRSDLAFQFGNIGVAGLIYTCLLSPPWFWFALVEDVSIGDLIDFRRLAQHIPVGALTAIRSDFERGKKFARLYGFTDTGEVHSHNNVSYNIYRRG